MPKQRNKQREKKIILKNNRNNAIAIENKVFMFSLPNKCMNDVDQWTITHSRENTRHTK